MQKRLWELEKQESTNQGGHFLDLQGFSWSYAHPKANLHSCKKRLSMALLILKFSICCFTFKYFVLTNFLKNAYFDRKFIKFL